MKANLIEGNIKKQLTNLTIPMIWGLISVIGFNLVDTYFVGKLGTSELAAMGFTFPIVIFFSNASLGLGIGASSVVSRIFGSGDIEKLKRVSTDSLSLALLIVAIFLIIGFLFIKPLLHFLGAKDHVFDLALDYMNIWFLGMIFVVVPMVGNGLIRALGNTTFPSLIMMLSGGLNAILDPIFIFGFMFVPSMGIKGAALATVISRFLTFVAALYVIHFKYHLLDFKIPKFQDGINSWKSVLKVGIPTAGSNVLIPLSISVLTAMLAHYGEKVVAAYGIVYKLEYFVMIMIFALSSAFGPFAGQNFGAKRYDRLKTALIMGTKFNFLWGAFISLILFLFGHYILKIFNSDETILSIGMIYLLCVPWSYFFEGERLLMSSYLNASGRPLFPTLFAIGRMFILMIPLSYLLSHVLDLNERGIFLGIALSNLIVGIFALSLIKKEMNRKYQN